RATQDRVETRLGLPDLSPGSRDLLGAATGSGLIEASLGRADSGCRGLDVLSLRADLNLLESCLGDAHCRLGLLDLGVERRSIEIGHDLALADLVADVDVQVLDAAG